MSLKNFVKFEVFGGRNLEKKKKDVIMPGLLMTVDHLARDLCLEFANFFFFF